MRKLLIWLGLLLLTLGLFSIWALSRSDRFPWLTRGSWPGVGALVGLTVGPSLLSKGLSWPDPESQPRSEAEID